MIYKLYFQTRNSTLDRNISNIWKCREFPNINEIFSYLHTYKNVIYKYAIENIELDLLRSEFEIWNAEPPKHLIIKENQK